MRRWISVALLGLGVAACSGVQKTVHPPKGELQLTSVFVYPFGFRWEEPPYRKIELSQRLLDTAIAHAGDELAFFGPTEFSVLKASDDGAWVASTALPLLLASGSRPEQGVILRPWAEKRVNSSGVEVSDKKGRAAGAASNEITEYFGHVEIVHPSTQEVLVDVQGQVTVDPFAAAMPEDEFDPARPLTALMAQLTTEALTVAKAWAASRPVLKPLGLTVALTPRLVLGYVEKEHPSLEAELSAGDPLQAELARQSHARFLAPWLPEPQLAKVVKAPVGIYVGAGPADAKVQPGDVIVSCEGKAALPQHLNRMRFQSAPQQCQVRRASGEETEVYLP